METFTFRINIPSKGSDRKPIICRSLFSTDANFHFYHKQCCTVLRTPKSHPRTSAFCAATVYQISTLLLPHARHFQRALKVQCTTPGQQAKRQISALQEICLFSFYHFWNTICCVAFSGASSSSTKSARSSSRIFSALNPNKSINCSTEPFSTKRSSTARTKT